MDVVSLLMGLAVTLAVELVRDRHLKAKVWG